MNTDGHMKRLNHFLDFINVFNLILMQFSGFLDKNRDMLTTDIKEMMMDSSNTFLKNLFVTEIAPTQSGSRKAFSLSHQFKTSLDALMKTLYACHPFFVRCIKPNEFKKPKVSIY